MVEKKGKEILNKEHELWDLFCEKLEGPSGCNLITVRGKTVWTCSGDRDKPLARKILSTFENINIEKTLQYYSDNGGHCDCEILLNIDK